MNASRPVRQPTISKILLAVDFSSRSEHAAWYARKFTKLYGSQLWIAHAVVPSILPDAVLVDAEDAVRYAEQHMARFIESDPLRDLSFQTLVRPGDLWEVLSQVVEEYGIDLIVAGTHGRNWLGRVMFGSTAELIVRNASCPVLTVSPHVKRSAIENAVLRIVFATDATQVPARVLAYAISLANENNAQVMFVHVLHLASGAPVDYPDEVEIDDDSYVDAMCRLKKIIPDAAVFRRDPEQVIESGVPADQLVRVAYDTGADLILMPVKRAAAATRGRVPWTTVSRVIAHATCPLLTVGH